MYYDALLCMAVYLHKWVSEFTTHTKVVCVLVSVCFERFNEYQKTHAYIHPYIHVFFYNVLSKVVSEKTYVVYLHTIEQTTILSVQHNLLIHINIYCANECI